MTLRALLRQAATPAVLAGPLLFGAACSDALGAGGASGAMVVLPDFGELAPFAANADRLRLLVTRVLTGTVAKDTTVGIDQATGEAVVELRLNLESGAEQYTVLLQAIRSSDGLVLFEGTQTVTVSPGTTAAPAQLPVTYVGPAAAAVSIQPRDTAVAPGSVFTFTAVARDAAQAVVATPVTFALVTAADSVILNVGKFTGVATAGTGPTGTVRVVARTPEGRTDTARVSVGAVPAGVRVTPGFATLGVGGTVTVAAELVDANGIVISPATATWVSRSPSVAGVSGTGVVNAAAAGTAVIVATAGSFSDSLLVRVAATGSVPVSAIAGGRAFRSPRVGDTVVVDVTADMTFTGGQVLGSYNAQLTWTAAVLRFVDVQPGGFGAPTVNTTQTAQGSLRFSAANAQGVGGAVVVARVRFVAQATGSAAPLLAITELSAAQTFTNLLSSVVVTNGTVTVRP